MTSDAKTNETRRTATAAGRDYLDSAVKAAKDHPAAAAGIVAGVAAVAAGAALGASALKARAVKARDEDLIIDPLNVPAEIPGGR